MDPEMLQQIAAFLGVEADATVILQALEALIAQLRDGTATEEYGEEEIAAMAKAVDAENENALMEKFNAFASALREMVEGEEDDEEENASASTKDYNALASFNSAFSAASTTAPANTKARSREGAGGGVPHKIREGQQKPGGASKGFGKNIGQLGRAAKPSIMQMILDIKAGGRKAQSYQTGPQGGFLLRQEVSTEILPALRDAIPLFDMGVREYPMDAMESLAIPKKATEATAYWVGEGTEITDSDETFETVTLVTKPLAARNIVPNKLLRKAVVNYEQQLRDDFVHKLRRGLMLAALEGSGGGAEPRGILNTTGVTITQLGVVGVSGAKPEIQDVIDLFGRIEDANVEINESAGLLVSPRTRRTFTSMADNEGRPFFRPGWGDSAENELLGVPFSVTNAISNTLTIGSDNDCSRIYGGVWDNLALGISGDIEFMVLDQPRGSRLQTEIIAYWYVDVAVLFEEAFEVLTGVRP